MSLHVMISRGNPLSLLTRDGCVSGCKIGLGLIHLIVDWFISFSAIVVGGKYRGCVG